MDRVDVAILGAGIVGASAAAHLAASDVKVMLVEETGVAGGASGRDVAYVGHPYDELQGPVFEESVVLMRDVGLRMTPLPIGVLLLARDRNVAKSVVDEMLTRQADLRPRLVEPDELISMEPGIATDYSACHLDTGFPVCARVATELFIKRATDRGMALHIGSRAALLWEGSACVGLSWDGGRVLSDLVIVAAGAATSGVVDPKGAWAAVRPIWGVDVELRLDSPPARVLVEARLAQAQAGTASRVEHGFSLVTAGERSALGSTFLRSKPTPDEWSARLIAHGARFVPALRSAAVVRSIACARPHSVDNRPLLGHIIGADNRLVATGNGGRGVSTGAACGRLVAEAVLSGSEECIPSGMRASRFPLDRGPQ
jgi:glycine/D-amino acid oxidase-like deaminating enzyme